jgi:4-hydroxy-tetrahydrodipicolinate reductase
MSNIKVAVLGAKGRMGSTTCEAVNSAAGMELVASLDIADSATSPSVEGDFAQAAAAAGAQVVVDFTVPDVTEANVHALIDQGLHVVVGATGWNEDSLNRVATHLETVNAQKPDGEKLGVLIAPNFAFSAILAMRFAALAAPYFESAEVIELHHPNKVDAPSGTAKSTASQIAAARAAAGLGELPDATTAGFEARGTKVDGIPVHAVRLRGMTASQEALFGNVGEALTIRADSFDRLSFMPGVLLAIREVGHHPGLTFGLDHFMPGLR